MQERWLYPLIAVFVMSCSANLSHLNSSTNLNATPGLHHGGLQEEIRGSYQAYATDTIAGANLQPGCEPKSFAANADVPYQGVVMMFHGFTSCPQQFEDLGRLTANEGFDVLIPLLPGQGRVPLDGPTGRKDDLRDLPTDPKPYEDFVTAMTNIVRPAKGLRIVTGLSMGGALALGAVEEDLNSPEAKVWDRALLMAPFLQIPGIQRHGQNIITKLRPTFVTGWGNECKDRRTSEFPRAGICEFQVNQVGAAAAYGYRAYELSGSIDTPIQIIGTENDGAADNEITFKTADGNSGIDLCFYKSDVPHPMIWRGDRPTQDAYWVGPIEEGSLAYFKDGTPFPTDGVSSEYQMPRCRL